MTEDTPESPSNALSSLSKIPLRLTRTTAMELGALTLVVIIAALIRVLPLQYGAYFTGYDPLFQYRATEYVVENGFGSWSTWHDTLSWYPMGRNVANSAYPGVPFTAALLYMVIKPLIPSATVYSVCLYFPLFMASLTCISSYFFGKELKGKAAGLFAAIFMAVNPAFLGRSSLGFFDTETIGIFSMVTIGIFFLRSIDEKKNLEHRVAYGVLSGLTLGYIFASWGAARYMTGLLILYMLILLYTERFETRHLLTYCLTIGFGFLIVIMVPRLGVNSLLTIDNLAAFGLVPVMMGYELVKDRIDVKLLANLAGASIIVGVLAIYLLPAIGIRIPMGYKFLRVLNPFTSIENALYNSVAENKVVAWASLFNSFGPVLVLAAAGTFFSMKNQNEKNIYGSLFFLTSLYFAGVMVRLSQILAAPACIMGAYGLVEVSKPFFTVTAEPEGSSRRKKRRRAVFGVNKYLGVFFILFIVIGFMPSIWRAVSAADSPTSLADSGIPYLINGEYSKDWPEALEWMKENVGDDEVICSWWDYGYWIESMAGKTTMADGATQTERQLAMIGNIMMLPQNESIKLLERYGADYIVVFYAFNPNNFYQSLRVGDDVKWSWMAQIGKLDLDEYLNTTTGQPTEKYLESTIANLMYRIADRQYFERMYASPNGYVLVYKIHYPDNDS